MMLDLVAGCRFFFQRIVESDVCERKVGCVVGDTEFGSETFA